MTTQITLPHLGESIDSGDVLSILVSEGDTIQVDQDLIEIETDKATMPVPSPEAGKVIKVLIHEGDTLTAGAPILELEAKIPTPGETASAAGKPTKKPTPPKPPAPKAEAPLAQPTPTPEPTAQTPPETPPPTTPTKTAPPPATDVPGDGHASAAAGPSVRRLARELGVELRRVRPSGEAGRVTEEDVRSYVRSTNEQSDSAAMQGVTPPGTLDSDGQGGIRREKLSRLRQTIARNMLASYSNIPQLTNFDDVDTTELERIRQDSKADYAESGIKLTAMPFLVKAVASALKLHPVINASIDLEAKETIYKEYVNIGIAVDTEKGLVVPVLRDADRKSIPQIARELSAIADSARSGSFSIEDLRGGTFTISNLGAIGGTYSTPIINPPEVAILLAGRSRILPQYVDDQLEPRLMMPLSITYDHRIVDGAAAARFLNEVKGYLANPGRLLLAP